MHTPCLKEYLLQEAVLKLPALSKLSVLRKQMHPELVWRLCYFRKTTGELYPVGYASKKLNLTEA